MGCRDIRETISAWVDGEASPEEAASVREHLASCDRCRVLERLMRAVEEKIDALINDKRSLANAVVGTTGEAWLSELSTDALRDLVVLDHSKIRGAS